MNGEITVSPDTPVGIDVVIGCGSIEVRNSKIHGAPGGYGFYWQGHDSTFDGNEVYNNGGFAYHIYHRGANDVSNNVISNNIIHGNGFNGPLGGNGAGGIILSSGSNNQALNNIIYGNYSGIGVNNATNTRVSGNIIYDNTYGRYAGITIGAEAFNTIVDNNTVYNNGRPGIDDYGVRTILRDNLTTP
jgi:parallel beta-helix repeat protein